MCACCVHMLCGSVLPHPSAPAAGGAGCLLPATCSSRAGLVHALDCCTCCWLGAACPAGQRATRKGAWGQEARLTGVGGRDPFCGGRLHLCPRPSAAPRPAAQPEGSLPCGAKPICCRTPFVQSACGALRRGTLCARLPPRPIHSASSRREKVLKKTKPLPRQNLLRQVELADLEVYCEEVVGAGRALVAWNLELDTLRADLGGRAGGQGAGRAGGRVRAGLGMGGRVGWQGCHRPRRSLGKARTGRSREQVPKACVQRWGWRLALPLCGGCWAGLHAHAAAATSIPGRLASAGVEAQGDPGNPPRQNPIPAPAPPLPPQGCWGSPPRRCSTASSPSSSPSFTSASATTPSLWRWVGRWGARTVQCSWSL